MGINININYLVNAMVFSIFGLIMLGIGLYAFDKLTPFKMWKELCDEHNTALAIVVGSCAIGISIIIASAIH